MSAIYNKLIEYRRAESEIRKIPVYCVFNNSVMERTIEINPSTIDDFIGIKGWGPKTITNYGSNVLKILGNLPYDDIRPPIKDPVVPTPVIQKQPITEIVLNEQQQLVYDTICKGKSVFISGEAGTGKTEIIKKFRRDFLGKKNIAFTSTTGTSALLMNGTTIHSCMGIGLGKGTVEQLETFISRPYLKGRAKWHDLDVLVIDEISMLDPALFDKLDQLGRSIRGSRHKYMRLEPWGGIQLILSGDFLQLPVVGSDRFTFEADSWNISVPETFILTQNVRQSGDNIWMNILSEIRMGIVTTETSNILSDRVKVDISGNGIIPTKLYAKNIDVDRINEQELDALVTINPDLVFVEYSMIVTKLITKKVSESVIEGYKTKCIALPVIELCVGAQVMLLTNKLEMNLSNGSRGVIERFSPQSCPIVRFTNGSILEIEEHDFQVSDMNGKPEFILRQIPLKIAYAISIHKSQGITLDCAEVDIKSCFCEGQAYVALSRVKSLSGLSITKKFNSSCIQTNEKCLSFYTRHM